MSKPTLRQLREEQALYVLTNNRFTILETLYENATSRNISADDLIAKMQAKGFEYTIATIHKTFEQLLEWNFIQTNQKSEFRSVNSKKSRYEKSTYGLTDEGLNFYDHIYNILDMKEEMITVMITPEEIEMFAKHAATLNTIFKSYRRTQGDVLTENGINIYESVLNRNYGTYNKILRKTKAMLALAKQQRTKLASLEKTTSVQTEVDILIKNIKDFIEIAKAIRTIIADYNKNGLAKDLAEIKSYSRLTEDIQDNTPLYNFHTALTVSRNHNFKKDGFYEQMETIQDEIDNFFNLFDSNDGFSIIGSTLQETIRELTDIYNNSKQLSKLIAKRQDYIDIAKEVASFESVEQLRKAWALYTAIDSSEALNVSNENIIRTFDGLEITLVNTKKERQRKEKKSVQTNVVNYTKEEVEEMQRAKEELYNKIYNIPGKIASYTLSHDDLDFIEELLAKAPTEKLYEVQPSDFQEPIISLFIRKSDKDTTYIAIENNEEMKIIVKGHEIEWKTIQD